MLNFLTRCFADRRSVGDASAMQIFRSPTKEEHAEDIVLALLFGKGKTLTTPHVTWLTGLIDAAATTGRFPAQWHLEYLADRWFLREQNDHNRSGYLTECRLVVDAWGAV